MTHIRSIFDADAIELHDLRADPNTVIKVQGLVKEMLEANDNRRLGIYQTLVEEYGTFALPGVISATYVLSDQLTNKKRQDTVAQLMVELCRDNPAAQRLLLRAGVIESPFDVSRQIAAKALTDLGELEIAADTDWLLSEAKRLAKEEERASALVIYELLLRHGIGFQEALDVCYKWFAGDYEAEAPASLMRLLLTFSPAHTEGILTKLFDSLERRDDEAGRVIKSTVDLSDAEALIPALRAASKRLERERTGTAKPVEYLFEGAVARQIVQSPECIPVCVHFIQTEDLHEGVTRYWWQALSSAVKLGSEGAKQHFDRDLAHINDEAFALWGYVQLMFIETAPRLDKQTKAWAAQTLQDLRLLNPYLHQQAKEKKELIVPGNATSGKSRKQVGNTGIN